MKNTQLRKVIWMIILFALFFSAVRLLAHYNFYNHALDDGYNDNLIWNTLHGKFFWSEIKGYCTLGDHLDPILLFFLPFYFMGMGPGILYVTQTLIIALGALPLYWLAKERLKDSPFVLLFPLAYLLYVPTVNINFAGFYQIALAITPLIFAFYYLLKDKYKVFLLWLAVALLCQEDIALITSFFGLYILLKKQNKTLGALLAAGGLALFIADIQFIIPFFRGSAYAYYERYGYLGASLGDKLSTIFFRPLYVAQYVLTSEKITYLIGLFLPVALLSFFSPIELIPALPAFVQNLLSTYGDMYKWGTRYPSALVPFIFISAILGMERLYAFIKDGNRIQRINTIIRRTMFFFMFLSLLYFFLGFFFRMTWITPQTLEGHRLLKMIPKKAAISALGSLYPHLAHRENIWIFSKNYEKSDYLILGKLDPTWPIKGDYEPVIKKLLKDNNYGKLLEFTFLGELPRVGLDKETYTREFKKVMGDSRFELVVEGKYYLLLKKKALL